MLEGLARNQAAGGMLPLGKRISAPSGMVMCSMMSQSASGEGLLAATEMGSLMKDPLKHEVAAGAYPVMGGGGGRDSSPMAVIGLWSQLCASRFSSTPTPKLATTSYLANFGSQELSVWRISFVFTSGKKHNSPNTQNLKFRSAYTYSFLHI